MDISFIISRTLVYTILTLGAVTLFTLIEYVFGRVLEHQGVATILNILAAVGLGVSFNLLHRHLDEWIDRFLFKQRHLAAQRLAAVARALPHASTAAAIEAALVDEPVAALGLSSAAVFRHEKSTYRRVRAHAWTDDEAAELDCRRRAGAATARRSGRHRSQRSALAAQRSAERRPASNLRRPDYRRSPSRSHRPLRRPRNR